MDSSNKKCWRVYSVFNGLSVNTFTQYNRYLIFFVQFYSHADKDKNFVGEPHHTWCATQEKGA